MYQRILFRLYIFYWLLHAPRSYIDTSSSSSPSYLFRGPYCPLISHTKCIIHIQFNVYTICSHGELIKILHTSIIHVHTIYICDTIQINKIRLIQYNIYIYVHVPKRNIFTSVHVHTYIYISIAMALINSWYNKRTKKCHRYRYQNVIYLLEQIYGILLKHFHK